MKSTILLFFLFTSNVFGNQLSINAIDSTTRYLTEPYAHWTPKISIQSSWINNPVGGEGSHYVISEGYVKFPAPNIPVESILSAYIVTSVIEARCEFPEQNPQPSVGLFFVNNNSWTRFENTYIPYQQQVSAYQNSQYTHWELSNIDWNQVQANGFLSVAFHNQTLGTYHPEPVTLTFNHVLFYNASSSLRPILIVEYVPEPSSTAMMLIGLVFIWQKRSRKYF